MLRLRDFLSRRGDPLQLEALTGELGLDRQLPEAEVAGPGLALAGTPAGSRPTGCTSSGRPRSPTSTRSRRSSGASAGEVLQLRSVLHLRHQGTGRPDGDAGAGRAQRRAPAPQQAQDRGVFSPDQAGRGGGLRAAGPRSTAPWPTSTASASSSSAVPASARASACSTWSNGVTAWWRMTWCR